MIRINCAGKWWNCKLKWLKYGNGNNALLAVADGEADPIAKLSVNPDEVLLENEIAIKDYDENRGVLHSLILSGVISEPVGWTCCAYETVPVCNILSRDE